MTGLVERLRNHANWYISCACGNVPEEAATELEAAAEITRLQAENASLREQVEKAREALEPFAKVGKLIDGPFGPALFADDDGAFQSGCGWTEDGEKKTLTWGDFRRARDARRAAGRTE